MKNQDLSKWSDEELAKKQSSVRLATGLMLVSIIVFFVVMLISVWMNQAFTFMLFLPFTFLPLLLHNSSWLKDINKEIEKRSSI